MPINWDQIEGNWKQFTGKVQQKWGQLTEDEVDAVAGSRDILIGKIQERYGIGREEAERQLEEFQNEL
jgi:uncharacterized protein YjbJ (UPF0337 family)